MHYGLILIAFSGHAIKECLHTVVEEQWIFGYNDISACGEGDRL